MIRGHAVRSGQRTGAPVPVRVTGDYLVFKDFQELCDVDVAGKTRCAPVPYAIGYGYQHIIVPDDGSSPRYALDAAPEPGIYELATAKLVAPLPDAFERYGQKGSAIDLLHAFGFQHGDMIGAFTNVAHVHVVRHAGGKTIDTKLPLDANAQGMWTVDRFVFHHAKANVVVQEVTAQGLGKEIPLPAPGRMMGAMLGCRPEGGSRDDFVAVLIGAELDVFRLRDGTWTAQRVAASTGAGAIPTLTCTQDRMALTWWSDGELHDAACTSRGCTDQHVKHPPITIAGELAGKILVLSSHDHRTDMKLAPLDQLASTTPTLVTETLRGGAQDLLVRGDTALVAIGEQSGLDRAIAFVRITASGEIHAVDAGHHHP